MIYICSTIIILAIIILLGFYLYLTKCYTFKIPTDDKIYKDRLFTIKNKYNKVRVDYDEEDEDRPIGVRQLMSLIKDIMDRTY